MIRLLNVSRKYGDDKRPLLALDDVTLEIARGEFVAVTGPSGSGKSTLMHIVGGLDTPSSGEVFVDELCLHRASEAELTAYRRFKLGIVFQFFNLMPTMNVFENISLPLLLHGRRMAEIRPRVAELIDLVGLSGRAGHFIHQLSGGELQRTAIARALIHEPDLLLADEPTGNLDSANAAQVIHVLQKISSQFRTTMLIVTHSEEVAQAASRRIHMRDGRLTDIHDEQGH